MVSNPFSTAREWDTEIQLYYYRARYYDPVVGRFLSADPVGFAGGVNFYVYAENNPIRFTDPFGLTVIGGPIGSSISQPKTGTVESTVEVQGSGWTVLVRCNVEKFDECAKCPPRVEGTGYGPTAYIAKYYGELDAKAKLKGIKGCYTRHCHGVRCWKNGNPVPCPWW